MGGCASRPKDSATNEPAPADAPTVDKPEAEPVAQENDGGEVKTEEPLVDLTKPKEEAPEKEKESSESKPASEAPDCKVEEKPEPKNAEVAAAEAPAADAAIPFAVRTYRTSYRERGCLTILAGC